MNDSVRTARFFSAVTAYCVGGVLLHLSKRWDAMGTLITLRSRTSHNGLQLDIEPSHMAVRI